MVFDHVFAENAPILVEKCIFLFFINPYFWLFFGVLEVKLKFQDKFYDIFDHNKCPPSETEDEKGIFRKSYFHRIQPNHNLNVCVPYSRYIVYQMLQVVLQMRLVLFHVRYVCSFYLIVLGVLSR